MGVVINQNMARKYEFIKKSEARILIYLKNCDNHLKCGKMMAEKLKIDYIYIMKLLNGMYEKGWLYTHQYNFTTYFWLSEKVPIEEAIKKVAEPQIKLMEVEHDNREVQEGNMAASGNEPNKQIQP